MPATLQLCAACRRAASCTAQRSRACHSTWQVWLEGLHTRLKTFDVFRLPYSNASREHIDGLYPRRVDFFKGSSVETVPRYVRDVRAGLQPPCDVWFVDGEHRGGTPLLDLKNAIASAADNATIIADDCTRRFPAVEDAWRALLLTGAVDDAFNRTLSLPAPAGLKGWCVGRRIERSVCASRCQHGSRCACE